MNTSENNTDLSNEYQYALEIPHWEQPAPTLGRSLINLGLFVSVFYFLFHWELNFILVLTGAVIFHELGHFTAMKIFGYKKLHINFIPFLGAYASGMKKEISQKQSAIIFLAGPVPGIIVGILLFFLGSGTYSPQLRSYGMILCILNMFNCLPVYPLDGGRLLQTLFLEKSEKISEIFLILSIGTLCFISYKLEDYFLLILPFFMLTQLMIRRISQKIRIALQPEGISFYDDFEHLPPEDYWKIRDSLPLYYKALSNHIIPGEHTPAPNEKQIYLFIKNLFVRKPKSDLGKGGKFLLSLTWILTLFVPFAIAAEYFYWW
jgi:Zn-dependent protease